MKRKQILGTLAVSLLLAISVSQAGAQSGGGWNLGRHSTGGGGTSSGGSFVLRGVAGQASVGQLSGGQWTVNGGYLQCRLAGDFDGNGIIDVTDVVVVASDWLATGSPYDLDGDGDVDMVDIMLVAGAFGRSC